MNINRVIPWTSLTLWVLANLVASQLNCGNIVEVNFDISYYAATEDQALEDS